MPGLQNSYLLAVYNDIKIPGSVVKATLAHETKGSLNWIHFSFKRLRQVRWTCHSTLNMHSLDTAPWVVYSYKTRPSARPWHPNSMSGNEFSNSMQGLTNQWALIKLADTRSTKHTGFLRTSLSWTRDSCSRLKEGGKMFRMGFEDKTV